MTDLAVVPTGTANLASVFAAFDRLGRAPVEATDRETVNSARWVVVPGVGAFGAAADAIGRLGILESLRARIDEGRPTLAVCVGMQLLCAGSEESPGATGLGVAEETVRRFPGIVKVPQLGWNLVVPGPGSLIEPGWAYFANSFRLANAPAGWTTAITDYGGEFVSAMQRGSVLACQFHPELSGPWGSRLLDRWLAATAEAA
jgi:imidazole glycerol phosphate synthase glutamine amidotransferase subunit